MSFLYLFFILSSALNSNISSGKSIVNDISPSVPIISILVFQSRIDVFVDENDPNGLSATAYSFMAGIMKHIEAMTIVLNPLINSYKRLVPDYEAPIYIAWSAKNRSPLIRVPSSRGSSTRIELRSADPSANPYLALALCLEAGLDGIERELTPPAPVDKNIFEMSQRELKRTGIRSLPTNMFDATSITFNI